MQGGYGIRRLACVCEKGGGCSSAHDQIVHTDRRAIVQTWSKIPTNERAKQTTETPPTTTTLWREPIAKTYWSPDGVRMALECGKRTFPFSTCILCIVRL